VNGNQSGLLPVAGGLLLGIRIGGKKIPSFCPKNLIRCRTDVKGKNFLLKETATQASKGIMGMIASAQLQFMSVVDAYLAN
jgi:hypothetical protein